MTAFVGCWLVRRNPVLFLLAWLGRHLEKQKEAEPLRREYLPPEPPDPFYGFFDRLEAHMDPENETDKNKPP